MITRSTFALCMAALRLKSVRSDTCLCLLVERRRARGYPTPTRSTACKTCCIYTYIYTDLEILCMCIFKAACVLCKKLREKILYLISIYWKCCIYPHTHTHRETRKTCFLCVFEKGPYLLRMCVGSRNLSPWQAFSKFCFFGSFSFGRPVHWTKCQYEISWHKLFWNPGMTQLTIAWGESVLARVLLSPWNPPNSMTNRL